MNKEMTGIWNRMSKLMDAEKYDEAFRLASRLVKMSHGDAAVPARDKAMIQNYAGLCLLYQSDHDKADKHFRQALAIVDGDEMLSQSLDKGIYLLNLARSRHSAGAAAEGDSLYRQAARIHSALMEPAAPEITNLLASCGAEAAHDEKIQNLVETMAMRAIGLAEYMYGIGYPGCLALQKLADRYQAADRVVELKMILLNLAEKYGRIFGCNSQVYGDICSRLARLFPDDAEMAKGCHNIVLAIQERLLSPDFVQLHSSLDDLAALHEKAGEIKEAEALLADLLVRLERHVPESSALPDVLSRLATIHANQGDFKRALAEQEKAVALSPSTEKTPGNLAIRTFQLGVIQGLEGTEKDDIRSLKKAASTYERALTMAERHFGRTHLNVSVVLESLAGIKTHLKSPSDAITFYRRALSIKRKRLGASAPGVAETLNDLALVYLGQKDYLLASKELRHALSILEAVSGKGGAKRATVMNNLAVALTGAGKQAEGLELAGSELCMREDLNGSDSASLITSLQNLAGLKALSGDSVEAKKVFDRAIHLAEIYYEPDSDFLKRLKEEQTALAAGNFQKPLSAFWVQES